MRPTAYVLFVVGLVLAASAALVYQTPGPDVAGHDGLPGGPDALPIALLAAAVGAAALGWVMLRYGGRGYTVTNSPAAQR